MSIAIFMAYGKQKSTYKNPRFRGFFVFMRVLLLIKIDNV